MLHTLCLDLYIYKLRVNINCLAHKMIPRPHRQLFLNHELEQKMMQGTTGKLYFIIEECIVFMLSERKNLRISLSFLSGSSTAL